MPKDTCEHCGGEFAWNWEEAFDKFGFNDGDSNVMTEDVAEALREHGFEVDVEKWGLHNVVITSIKRDGKQCIPDSATYGYDDPRDYLPQYVLDVLEAKFGDVNEPATTTSSSSKGDTQ